MPYYCNQLYNYRISSSFPLSSVGCVQSPSELVPILWHSFRFFADFSLFSLVQRSACLTTDHEIASSIPGTSTDFKCELSLERGPREDNWVAT